MAKFLFQRTDFLGLGGALLLAACAPGEPPPEKKTFDQLFADYLAREKVPGIALVVLKGDEVAHRQGFGVAGAADGEPMRTDSLQPIYSVSKQFTAVLILRLVDAGLIDLNAPVGRLSPRVRR